MPKMKTEILSRLDKLRSAFKDGVDGFIISSSLNQQYISGFDFSDGYILVTSKKAYIITDFRYEEAAREAAGELFEIVVPRSSLLLEISGLLKLDSVKNLYFEDRSLSYADYLRFSEIFEGVTLVKGGSECLDTLREIKSEVELDLIEKAQNITDSAFEHILKVIKPDMTEVEVAIELEFFMRRAGAQALAFDIIAVSGKASALPHGTPSSKKLEKGFLTLDFGARLDGYCSDMTRTIVIGKADDDMKKLYGTVLSAQKAALDLIEEGKPCFEIDKVARDIIDNAGYCGCFGHGLGHGVGMYIHESPRISFAQSPSKLFEAGHVITVEPGIYISGKYGCRIEDMVAVTKRGVKNFTQSPKELIELF